MRFSSLLFLLPLASASKSKADTTFSHPRDPLGGCTALAISAGAMSDGSTVVTHGNDCPSCDFRMAHVPAKSHPPGSVAEIFMAKNDYPRFYGYNLSSSSYSPDNTENPFYFVYETSKPMGTIPQVSHTYSYVDGSYGLMNEYQLAIGESTCGAVLGLRASPIAFGGSALFDIAALSRVALERCKTARCAIQTMGDLAVEYGFYGGELTDWTPELMSDPAEGGEALTIADGVEVWVFNISPDTTGTSAVWAAQRVPEGHLTVVTNSFNVGKLDLSNPDYFMASGNVFAVAAEIGEFNPDTDETLDFAKVFTSGAFMSGEHLFVDRRKWEVFRMVAPSFNFDPYVLGAYDDSDSYFPFSVPVEKPLTLDDVMRLHRDYFQSSPFDMSKNLIAGPFGDPSRVAVPRVKPYNDSKSEWVGGFERAISQTWTSYTSVAQSRAWLPRKLGGRVWYGPHDAATTVFVPVYPGANSVPSSTLRGSLLKADMGSMYWASCIIGNYMARFFTVLLPEVQGEARRIEADAALRASRMEADAATLSEVEQELVVARFHEEEGKRALGSWWAFFFNMATTNHDGSNWIPDVTLKSRSYAFPAWYLKLVGKEGAGLSEYANKHPDGVWDSEGVGGGERDKPKELTAAKGALGGLILTASALVVGVLAGLFLSPHLKSRNKNYRYSPEMSNSERGKIRVDYNPEDNFNASKYGAFGDTNVHE